MSSQFGGRKGWQGGPGDAKALIIKRTMSSESLIQRLSLLDDYWPGSELLNPSLLFGTAWFWALPEVHEAQKEIDARNAELRQLINQTV